MLQFDLQFYEELTVARVKTVKFISGAFFGPTGQLVNMMRIRLFHLHNKKEKGMLPFYFFQKLALKL